MRTLFAFSVISIFLLLEVGCKKSDPVPVTQNPYVPVNIQGKWLWVETYDKTTTSTITYPEILDSAIVEFKDLSQLNAYGICNGSSGKYWYTETGGIQVSDFAHTSIFCGGDEDIWENRLFSGVEFCYHYVLSNNNSTLRLYSSTNYDLIFEKVD